MKLTHLFMCLLAVLLISIPARSGGIKSGPFADVPPNHWAYDAVSRLAENGVFTGYPNGAFSAKRVLTRYEFAVAIQRMAQEASRVVDASDFPVAAPWAELTVEQRLRRIVARRLGERLPARPQWSGLGKLVGEFGAELKMLGADLEALQADIRRAEGPPEVEHAAPPRTWSADPQRRQGEREARAEWRRGEVTFYTVDEHPKPGVDPLLGIPYRTLESVDENQERIAGHNEEVYRLTLVWGLPPNSRREHLPSILDPAQAWARPSGVVRLDGAHRTAVSRDRQLYLKLKAADRNGAAPLFVQYGDKSFELPLRLVERSGGWLEALPGPNGAELLFIRYGERDTPDALTYAVLDLHSGVPLNIARVAAP